ncbi:MAG TPA: hypothetical protein VEQ63_00015, partial [Bryobacteraceae bacterium]|nr:hypothetical protein [Bryobacteraceae bacterium]
MFRSVLPLAFAVLGAAQEESAPVGIVRADVSVLIIRGASGTMDLSTSAGEQYQCDFDSQSLFERDQLRIQASDVRKGEFAEVVSDRKRGRCYARIVRLIPRTSPTVRSA